MNKDTLIKFTKYILDFMFFGGIVVTATLPWLLKWIGNYRNNVKLHYEAALLIYFVLGIAAIAIIWELRKIFKTVIDKNCFITANVTSLNTMCKWSFFIVLMSIVRTIVYGTIAMAVIILVFTIDGLFSKVLAFVFEQAVEYKEENDFTI